MNWTVSDYIYNHSVWTEASSSSEQLTVKTSVYRNSQASPCVASGTLSVKVTLWTLLSITQEVTLSNQTSHSDPPTTAGLNKALHTSHKRTFCLRDACCELMTAANRLVRARHDFLTHAHTSPNMSFNNLQKKKKFNFKEEEEQVTISVWYRTLPIFAQTAHYAWPSSARLLKASTCSNIWHLCHARFFAKKKNIEIFKDCEPIQHQWVCNFHNKS